MGRAFGDYELMEKIGRGGMGVVFKARQLSLNRLVALKLVSSGEFASPAMVHRFHLEAEAAANLHHPNIVPVYETGEVHGQHFFSMELIDGAGLDRFITTTGYCFGDGFGVGKAAERAREEQIARLIAKVALAVADAHQHGVLHRDIKPGNILIDRRGEPHLTDFGVAKVLGHSASGLTASGAIIGTPSFMAPEQAAGETKRVTTAADIYSLGAVLYSMLTGHPPFRGDTPVQTLKQVIEQDPKHPSTLNQGVDRDLATICLKCMEKEPLRRYSSATAVAEDLERWLQGETIVARTAGAGERCWRWCKRNPKLAALSSAVALLLVAVAVLSTLVAIHIAAKNKSVRAEAKREADRNEDLKTRNQFLQQMLIGELGRLWAARVLEAYTVASGVMRVLTGKDTVRPGLEPGLHLTFGTYFYQHPTNVVRTLAPALLVLEEDLTARLGRTVTNDLRIFNRYQPVIDALASNGLHFGRIGPSSYVQLIDKGAPVSLLAVQDSTNGVTLAIFARKGSEIANRYEANTNTPLVDLIKNRSFAFGDTNSTTGYYLAKWFLVSKGVYAMDLGRQENQIAQDLVLAAVSTGTFDVGAANLNLVAKNPEFVVLATYPLSQDVGRCWVASQAMNPAIATEVQKWLLALRDPVILESLSSSEGKVTGFKLMPNEALDALRKIMREAAAFDSRGPRK